MASCRHFAAEVEGGMLVFLTIDFGASSMILEPVLQAANDLCRIMTDVKRLPICDPECRYFAYC